MMADSKCPCLTLSSIYQQLDTKIWLVLLHQLILPSTLLAPATNIQKYKATKMQMLKPLTYELFFQNGSKICNSKIIRMYYMLNHGIRCMSSTVNHLFHILIHVNQNQSKSIKVGNRVTDFCRLISIEFLFLSTFKTIDMLCPFLLTLQA